MTTRRILAALVAVVLIGAAVLVRATIDDDESDAPESSTDVTGAPADAGTVVCASELGAACAAIDTAFDELDVIVEPAGTTLDRLAALPDGSEPPLWLTVQPYPAMVDSLRTAAALEPLGATGGAIAATPLVVATPTGGRADVLQSGCADAPLWRCIGDSASAPWTDLGGDAAWRTVRPSLGNVVLEATALGSFAAAVGGYFGAPQVSRSTWEADTSFIPWLRRLAGAVDPSTLSAGTPLATMVNRPSALDVGATSAAAVAALGATAERFDASYPEPSMWLQAVLAVPGGASAPGDLATTATTALRDAGWDAAAAATQPLPSASTMLALRALWEEAT
ncbi:MAG: hypothetical protein ABW328_05200 [Ilumatobacteraceae bacterium]